jgi:tryptophan halogenase
MKITITIVGAGTAGIIAASYLKSLYKNDIDIILIYDHKNPVIGVGESTTPIINQFLNFIGITKEELIRECGSTIKLGIKFKNWLNDNNHYYHNFRLWSPENFDDDKNLIAAHEIANDCYDGGINYGRYLPDNNRVPNEKDFNCAIHIDSFKFGRYIENKFANQITIIDSTIKDVIVKDNKIDQIILEDGRKIFSDFYVDASGFAKILISKLNSNWIDKKYLLPIDSAITCSVYRTDGEINPYTLAEASSDGWIWQIPLVHRDGIGYLFSSEHSKEEDCSAKFEKWLQLNHKNEHTQFKKIRFNTGYFQNSWVANCLSIGLSSGFVEPLESTSIHTAVAQIINFSKVNIFSYDLNDIQNYNKKISRTFENIYYFIRLHYHVNREDSQFWKFMKKNTPDFLKDLEYGLLNNFPNNYDLENKEVFDIFCYNEILSGINLMAPKNICQKYIIENNVKEQIYNEYLKITSRKEKINNDSISHREYLNYYCN